MCFPQESEDAVKVLAKEKDMLEREKWDLRRQTKEATEQANILRSQMDMKENRIKELEAELTMVSHSAPWIRPRNSAELIQSRRRPPMPCYLVCVA